MIKTQVGKKSDGQSGAGEHSRRAASGVRVWATSGEPGSVPHGCPVLNAIVRLGSSRRVWHAGSCRSMGISVHPLQSAKDAESRSQSSGFAASATEIHSPEAHWPSSAISTALWPSGVRHRTNPVSEKQAGTAQATATTIVKHNLQIHRQSRITHLPSLFRVTAPSIDYTCPMGANTIDSPNARAHCMNPD